MAPEKDARIVALEAEPGIPVTEEMIEAGLRVLTSHWHYGATSGMAEIYRVMVALAPVPLVTAAEDRVAVLEAEVSQWKAIAQKATDAFNQAVQDSWDLRDRRMVAADDAGNHNYHGPIKDGKAIPDETHERFHGAIGDVLAGNVIRPARDQMERALADAKAKDDKAPKPLRPVTISGDPRRIGWPT